LTMLCCIITSECGGLILHVFSQPEIVVLHGPSCIGPGVSSIGGVADRSAEQHTEYKGRA